MLAACSPASPVGLPPPAAGQGRSWMAPDAVHHTLIYVGGDEASYVFTTFGKLVGSIAQSSFGTCSDRNGDVFLTKVNGIVEYAHGGMTPIATFTVPGTAYSCSVDPTTGRLAAVVFCLSSCSGDEVVILRAPGEPAIVHRDRKLHSLLFCAYDAAGNLFVDGYNGSQFGLSELPKGKASFANIALQSAIRFGAQVQWDGQNLTIETNVKPAIYRIQVSGTTGKVIGKTKLRGVGTRAAQSWIENGFVAVPTGPRTKRAIEVIFWNYPGGGKPAKRFRDFIGGGHQQIDGVTFSNLPKGAGSR
jgi:hypothetical protein